MYICSMICIICVSYIHTVNSVLRLPNKSLNDIAGKFKVFWELSKTRKVRSSGNFQVEDNKLDTHKEEELSQLSEMDIIHLIPIIANIRWWYYISLQKDWSSLKLERKYEQAAKEIKTLNSRILQPWDLSAEVKILTCASGGPIVKVSLRLYSKRVNVISTMKWSSQNYNSFRMYSTGRIKTESSPFVLNKKSKLIDILQNELAKYNSKENGKYYGFNLILGDPFYWAVAYKVIKLKPWNKTERTYKETLDKIDMNYFKILAQNIVNGKYKPSTIRIKEITKDIGKKRLLVIDNPRDKIIQVGVISILEAIYEPMFLDCSYGFRLNRSAHLALKNLYLTGSKYSWIIQGNIRNCFDNISHSIIMKDIENYIGCPNFLSLIWKLLRVNKMMPNNTIAKNKIGVPEGNILGPILTNIILHKLDKFMEEVKDKFRKGLTLQTNSRYYEMRKLRKKVKDKGDLNNARKFLKELRFKFKHNLKDANFRRLYYQRYANDFIVLTICSYKECVELRSQISKFLRENCGLELNIEKITISKITKGFSYLGAECRKIKRNPMFLVKRFKRGIISVDTPRLLINAPIKKIISKLKEAKIIRIKNNKIQPICVTNLVNLSHFDILNYYNIKLNGILNYYSFAANRSRLGSIVWILKASCASTLGRKYKLKTLAKVFKKFGYLLKDIDTGIEFNNPTSLKALHLFKVKENNKNFIVNMS